MEKMLTLAQVADLLGVSVLTVRRWALKGYFATHKTGGLVRIAPKDLERWLAENRREAL